ncbi:MAG TPA: peptidase S8 [Bacteroidetes bacterium]|nr:peptidase S8 [Bacteroidota bacterium]
MKLRNLFIALLTALPFLGFSQYSVNTPPKNWQHLDKVKDGFMGVSADKMYAELLKGKKSQTVIVAVIDGGVDPLHEDLKDVMWHNPGEIPGNGKDDDGNGYVDDVYGWNFIGGKDGKNVHHDQLESTRLVAKYKKQFKNVDPSSLSKKDRKKYDEYKKLEASVVKEREEAASNAAFYGGLLNAVNSIVKATGKEKPTAKDISKLKLEDEGIAYAAQLLGERLSQGQSVDDFKEELQDGLDYFGGQADYYYNTDIDVRSIVGDNYADSYERYYGNNDVRGPDADHGTHVAGTIAAARNNGVGMNGIADNVKIMAVRCVPDGDERDKDVANAIIYAVDNGASVINMSFGKGQAWDKDAVDKAVKYAMKNDVLMVHAAGNSHQDNDVEKNFPNDSFRKKGFLGLGPKMAKNWLEIGALSWKGGEDAAANFSNYGKKGVDVFAPGVDIYATFPDNHYKAISGTSMASPVAAGVAAVIRSYYPELSAVQVKDIIMSSTTMTKNAKVKKPGGNGELVPFSELSVTGGAVNGYEAIKKASTVKPKKKKNKWRKSGTKAGLQRGSTAPVEKNKA